LICSFFFFRILILFGGTDGGTRKKHTMSDFVLVGWRFFPSFVDCGLWIFYPPLPFFFPCLFFSCNWVYLKGVYTHNFGTGGLFGRGLMERINLIFFFLLSSFLSFSFSSLRFVFFSVAIYLPYQPTYFSGFCGPFTAESKHTVLASKISSTERCGKDELL
jgi:hypothetical protein